MSLHPHAVDPIPEQTARRFPPSRGPETGQSASSRVRKNRGNLLGVVEEEEVINVSHADCMEEH